MDATGLRKSPNLVCTYQKPKNTIILTRDKTGRIRLTSLFPLR